MASASMTVAMGAVVPALGNNGIKLQKRAGGVKEMKAFAGMKAENHVNKLGCGESTEMRFARAMAAQCKAISGRGRGGAATSTCSVSEEIFRIIPIMSGLVLVGIALGFVLLRIEAAVEEAEAE